MKKIMITLCLISSSLVNLFSQLQANNFEVNQNLDIQIDSTSSDTIWQIGSPQKNLFSEALSPPNALVSDTIGNYASNLNASFIVELDEESAFYFPYIQLEWFQKIDMEDGVDGGIIEASFDQGQTWSNVFDDPIYRPAIVGAYQLDTLHNDKAGVTGTSSEWEWMAICWGSYTGTPPSGFSTIQIRFTMISDSVDTNQEGWMFDNFLVLGGIIGSTVDQTKIRSISVFPNPATQDINLDFSGFDSSEVDIQIYNTSGVVVQTETAFVNNETMYKLPIVKLNAGIYYVIIKTDDLIYRQRFMKSE